MFNIFVAFQLFMWYILIIYANNRCSTFSQSHGIKNVFKCPTFLSGLCHQMFVNRFSIENTKKTWKILGVFKCIRYSCRRSKQKICLNFMKVYDATKKLEKLPRKHEVWTSIKFSAISMKRYKWAYMKTSTLVHGKNAFKTFNSFI